MSLLYLIRIVRDHQRADDVGQDTAAAQQGEQHPTQTYQRGINVESRSFPLYLYDTISQQGIKVIIVNFSCFFPRPQI